MMNEILTFWFVEKASKVVKFIESSLVFINSI